MRTVQFASEPGCTDSFISGAAPYYYTHPKGAFCVSETQLHLAKLSVTATTAELSSNRKQAEHCLLVRCRRHGLLSLNPEPLDRPVRTAAKTGHGEGVWGEADPAAGTTEDPLSDRVTGPQRCDICKVGTRGPGGPEAGNSERGPENWRRKEEDRRQRWRRAGQQGARADGRRGGFRARCSGATSQPRLASFCCSTTWWLGRARLLFFFLIPS